jgi:hypothetical protein
MDFKQIFLNLTQYTIPFGYESELQPLLPTGWKKDSIGNYYYEIGNSQTLFTSHLDTASKERQKINHVIEGNIIKTDGTTILGGDNKAGCTILFYLIENKIPGTYYFFLGEEMAVHKNYPYGSLMAIEEHPDYFKKFKRIISFDRKETGQLITRQLGRNCCSDEFADALIDEFNKSGVHYSKDKTGYYTDSAFFGDLIPEIVNLSCGVWNEHTKNEYVNIDYVEQVAKAAVNVDWESLPVVKQIENKYQTDTRKDVEERGIDDDMNIFGEVFNILDEMYYVCHEFRSYQNYLYNFKPGRVYHFVKWHEDEELEISIQNGIINCNNQQYNIEQFKHFMGIEKLESQEIAKRVLGEFTKSNNKLSDATFNAFLFQKGGEVKTLKNDLRSLGYTLNKIGKGWEVIKEYRKWIKTFEGYKKN